MMKISLRLSNKGFTLVEILVALAISGIIITILTKIYSNTLNSYSIQDEIQDMNQNARFIIKEISDILSQAGADCAVIDYPTPDMDTIIKISGAGPVYNEFTVKVNPRGGLYTIPTNITLNTSGSFSLSVNDASTFRYASKLARIPRAGSSDSTIKIYNLVSVDTSNNTLYLNGGASNSATFYSGDVLYSFNNNRYFLHGSDLCVNDTINVLAENISLFQITFYTISGDSILTSSPPWRTMRSASLLVEATTSNRLQGKKQQRIRLSNQFRLRNRFGEDS